MVLKNKACRFLCILLCITAVSAAYPDSPKKVKIACFEKDRVIEFHPDGVSGFAVDLLEYIAEQEGWSIEWMKVTFPASLQLLSRKSVDLVVPLGYTWERDEEFDFSSEELLTTWGRVYTRERSDINSLLDLKDKKVGFVKDSLFYPVLFEITRQFGIECSFVQFNSYDSLFIAVSRGELDAGLGDRLKAYSIPARLKISENPIVFYPFGLHVAAAEGDPHAYLAAIDSMLGIIKRNDKSRYYQSQKKWFGQLERRVFPRWILISAGIILIGAVLIVLWTLSLRRQVTARTREIEHLRNLLSNIINSMPSALIGVDQQERVIQWNRQAEKITGISPDSAMGKTLHQLLPDFEQEMRELSETIRTRSPFSHHKRSRADGSAIRYEDVSIFPLIANGVTGAVIRIDDVTEKTRLEEMMIQSEKMISIGGLAAGMAHEINNPLAGIIQNTVVAKNRLSSNIEANRLAAERAGTSLEVIHQFIADRNIDDMLQNVIDSGKRASSIVKNMLGFARKGGFQKKPVDIPELVDRTVELARSDYNLKKEYDFRNIHITREYEPGIPAVVCEATKIQQVLLNLLRNGAEAMSDPDFRARQGEDYQARFILRLRNEEEDVCIEIEDNGPGMSSEVKTHIFEPFYTTKEVGRGTGLGLSVSYFIIAEDHGGSMGVESSPGKGSLFIIRLPSIGRRE